MEREIESLKTKLFRQRIVSYAIIGTLTLTLSLALSIKQLQNSTPAFALGRVQPARSVPDKRSPAQGHILVKFKQHVDNASETALLHRNQLMVSKEIGSTGVKIVKIPVGKDPVLAQRDLIQKERANIEFAETDDLVEFDFEPNDTYYSIQWHLPVIQAPDVWDEVQATDVLIGNCDTGVMGTHEDLSPIIRSDLGYNTVDNSTNWQPVHYHGTLTSGASAAVVNNSKGVAGVAINASIIPIRISNLPDGGAYVSDAAECIIYAAENGARAINLSYRMPQYETIHQAALQAETLGAVTVVSASNDNTNPGWPDFDSFLAVAATDQSDQRAAFSNWGPYVDLTAPGVNIVTTHSDGGYVYASGTSLSAPLVSGTIALLFGAKPDLTVENAKTLILENTDDIGDPGDDSVFGHGRLNTYKAVSAALGHLIPSPTAQPTPQATPTLTPTATQTPTPTPVPDTIPPTMPTNLNRPNNNAIEIPLQWDASTDESGIAHYIIYRNGSSYATTPSTLFIDQQTSAGTWYDYYVTAVDPAGNESDRSNTISVVGADSNNGVFFGQVIDADGNPLPDSTVVIKRALRKKNELASVKTDTNGRYTVLLSESNDYTITISKNGFDSITSDQTSLIQKISKEFNALLSLTTKGNSGNKGKKSK